RHHRGRRPRASPRRRGAGPPPDQARHRSESVRAIRVYIRLTDHASEEVQMTMDITLDRRRFLAGALTSVAASQLTMTAAASGGPRTAAARQPPGSPDSRNRSFGTLKQVDAGVLRVGYAEAGPPRGPMVILLHGWPYDIHSFVDVAPLLASAGYRVIIPHL